MNFPWRLDGSGDRRAVALVDAGGKHTYGELDRAADRVAANLLAGRPELGEERIAFQVAPGFAHSALLLGLWRAGAVAVPLALSHPTGELTYTLGDSRADRVVGDDHHLAGLHTAAAEHGLEVTPVGTLLAGGEAFPGERRELAPERRALMLYTSGTTGRPKGVVTRHGALRWQIETLHRAWAWSARDHILLPLPLHHTHGLVNVLCCALAAGATCEVATPFDAAATWRRLASGEISVYMAVPTLYAKLIAAWEALPRDERRAASDGVRKLRLMISGSAALPVPVLEQWREITGHTLLERYGMTEIGMALSNPLQGERRPGMVGQPLPGVEVRLVDEAGATVAAGGGGELEVRGPGVFEEYWQRPEETRRAFRDGWFRTGDEAVWEAGAYRILGRQSTDILKCGGYKISALEIEQALGGHPAIAACAVIGLPDETWGQRVAAAVVLRPDNRLTLDDLRAWAGERLAPYKLPTRLVCLPELPRNALGKVTKPALVASFESPPER
ncbi:MAG: acyl-CoA synthetase [Acidobacteriota bacterium]